MLTVELVKKNIDLFRCLGLEGGNDDEQAKVLFEFEGTDNIPRGLVILISSTYNSDIGDDDFDEGETRSSLAVFLEGKGFIANVHYQAWSEESNYKLLCINEKKIIVKNYSEVKSRKKVEFGYDAETKKFSYFNGKEKVFVDEVGSPEVDFIEMTGTNIFSLNEFKEYGVNHERLVFMNLDDIEPGLFVLKPNIVNLLENRSADQEIGLTDRHWVEYPYPENDDIQKKLFESINNALNAGGGFTELENICQECRDIWNEEDEEEDEDE